MKQSSMCDYVWVVYSAVSTEKVCDITHVNCWVANLVTIRGQSPIFWIPKSFELQKFRHWTLNNGLLKLGIRFRTLDFRFWTTDFGLWSTKQYYALTYSLSTNLVTIDEGRSSSRLRSESSTVRFVSSQHFFAINKTSTITRSVGQTNYFFFGSGRNIAFDQGKAIKP